MLASALFPQNRNHDPTNRMHDFVPDQARRVEPRECLNDIRNVVGKLIFNHHMASTVRLHVELFKTGSFMKVMHRLQAVFITELEPFRRKRSFVRVVSQHLENLIEGSGKNQNGAGPYSGAIVGSTQPRDLSWHDQSKRQVAPA